MWICSCSCSRQWSSWICARSRQCSSSHSRIGWWICARSRQCSSSHSRIGWWICPRFRQWSSSHSRWICARSRGSSSHSRIGWWICTGSCSRQRSSSPARIGHIGYQQQSFRDRIIITPLFSPSMSCTFMQTL